MQQAEAHPELKNTVFGEVFVELLEARGISADPTTISDVVEGAGVDGFLFLDRMKGEEADYPGSLGRLEKELGLSPQDTLNLSMAFAFEKRMPPPPRSRMIMVGGDED